MAFGPFRGRELVFAGDGIPAGALHVVYGANEAGKSTALRAVSGLLFGIPTQTGDAFSIPTTDLRLGAVLEGGDGTVVDIVRRKGKKNTLLDPHGNVLDDGLLRRLSGAATEATFRALFGLDHVSLREGAEALLAGQGDVGESLFEAALGGGGRGIHRVLQELEAEAEALFTPKAHKRKLNDAISAYQEARATVRLKARSGEAWKKQQQGLEEARADHERLADLLRGRKRELHRLERARRLLPLAARRDRLLQRLAALGEVTVLPAEASKAREAALNDRAQAAAELARLRAEIAEITARRDALSVPSWLDDPVATRLAELPDRLGAHRKAVEDRPRLLGALATCQAQADALAVEVRGGQQHLVGTGRAGKGVAPPAAPAMLGVAERARVRSLSHLQAALVQRQEQSRRLLEDLQGRHRVRTDELANLPVAGDATPLRRLLRRVERDGDLEARQQAAADERRQISGELNWRVTALGFRTARGSPQESATEQTEGASQEHTSDRTDILPARLLALTVPPGESVDKFAAELQALSAREDRLAEDVSALQRRARAARRKLGELSRGSELPTIHNLAQAREARDEAWRALWAALRPAPATEDGGAVRGVPGVPAAVPDWQGRALDFESAAADADDAADRLLRDAERVVSAAAIQAEQDEIDRQIADADVQRTDLGRRRGAAAVWWNALWVAIGVEPQGPEDMRAWLRRFTEACDTARALQKAAAEVNKLDEQARRARLELREALRRAGARGVDTGVETGTTGAGSSGVGDGSDGDGELGMLCEQAAAVAQALEEATSHRATLAREIATLAADLTRARRDHQEAEVALADWRAQWAAAISPLGLSPAASAAEAEAVLEVAAALARKQDEASEARRRLQSIDRDATQFEETVRALVGGLMGGERSDLTGRPVDEAAEIILMRHRDGVQARLARVNIEDDLRRRMAAARAVEAAHAEAETTLESLVRAAGVTALGELEAAELRSAELLELRRQVNDSEDQIVIGADGLALDAALQEVSGANADEIDDRIERMREEIEELERETQSANRAIGSATAGLLVLENAGEADAADAADEAQAHLARIRALAEDYARLRLAARILSREIERYREQHQGPVLLRASTLLARLTVGRYAGLRADFDESDRPVLRCLRADGTKVSVEGLSDGTRDQLYLALRLATLERQAAGAEPLPLILDDILIHFDDERAGAALSVLAEHAKGTQVVLFTHHARIVDLAQRILPASSLQVSRLDA